MNFCSECGSSVSLKTPMGDNRLRYVCNKCDVVHYQNPRIITGTLPIAPDGRILLCKRNIEPRKNYWTLPAGFMENGESTLEGALRETVEESCAKVNNSALISVISLPTFDQVHLFYQVTMTDFTFSTTSESNEVKLFTRDQIPWSNLAFQTVKATLEHYFKFEGKPIPVLNMQINPSHIDLPKD